MIENHSATEDVRTYLQTLIDTKVIHNLIEAIIEFNKDQTDALDKLLTTEEIELQAMNTRDTNANANAEDIQVTIASSNTMTDQTGIHRPPIIEPASLNECATFFAGAVDVNDHFIMTIYNYIIM